jgi:hypothetical protein
MIAKVWVLFFSVTIFAMESPSAQTIRYTMGMKIPNDTYASKKINPVHITITYLGVADNAQLQRAKQLLEEIHRIRPVRFIVGPVTSLPTASGQLPVRLLLFEKLEIEEKFAALHQELGECEPSQPAKFEHQIPHISLKDPALSAELSAKEGTILIGGKLFIKQLGNFDPIIELE